jgi:subtilisin family serine protease
MDQRAVCRFAPAFCLFSLTLAEMGHAAAQTEGSAAISPQTRAAVSFFDGDRATFAERLGAPAVDSRGRSLTPIRLRQGARTYEAFVDHTAIVRVEGDVPQLLARKGLRVVEPLMPSIGLFLVEGAEGDDGLATAARLADGEARRSGIRDAVPNLYVRIEPRGEPFVPNDPLFAEQWFFDEQHLGMAGAWNLTRGDAETTVVVIDSGCDLSHPDLVDKLDPGLDVVDGDEDPSFDPSYSHAAHGTACAGLVGASSNNGAGIAGACPECRIRCVRLLADEPMPLSAHIRAFDFALQTGAAVVSNSWGPKDPMPVFAAMRDAIDHLSDHGRGGKGAVVMFAAGNDNREIGNDEVFAVRGVTAVGAVERDGHAAWYSNRGAALDLVAPIGTVTTDITGNGGLAPGDYTSMFRGTSAACPVAAGVAALLASACPELTSAEMVDVLLRSARPSPDAMPDEKGHDPVFGHGMIEPVAALEMGAEEMAARPPPADAPVELPAAAGLSCSSAGTSAPARWTSDGIALLVVLGKLLRRLRNPRRPRFGRSWRGA